MKLPLIAPGILFMLMILNTQGDNGANFKKTVCILYDKTVFTNYSCSAKAKSRTKTVVNIYGHLTKRINELSLHLQLLRKINVIYRPFLVNVTEDFCQRFAKTKTAPYLNILHAVGERFSNLNHSCPYEGWMIFKDFELDLSAVKLLLPDGEYRFDIEPIINQDRLPAFSMQFFFEFVTKFG